MTDYTIRIVSPRVLFRKTFAKLLALMDASIVCQELDGHHLAVTTIPLPAEGALLLDGGARNEEQITHALIHLLTLQPEATLILVLDEQDDVLIDAAMQLGVTGVVIKATPPQVIIDALQRILSGERCRPAPVVDVAREDIPEHMRRQLSARQQKMLRAIMGGQSISATARDIGVTPARLVSDMRQVIATIRGKAL